MFDADANAAAQATQMATVSTLNRLNNDERRRVVVI
jgi:hypothetical protein